MRWKWRADLTWLLLGLYFSAIGLLEMAGVITYSARAIAVGAGLSVLAHVFLLAWRRR